MVACMEAFLGVYGNSACCIRDRRALSFRSTPYPQGACLAVVVCRGIRQRIAGADDEVRRPRALTKATHWQQHKNAT
jgi:hypothetical protein